MRHVTSKKLVSCFLSPVSIVSEAKKLPYEKNALKGISEKTLAIHYDKLYLGYVSKYKEIGEKLSELRKNSPAGNATFSELRGLKRGEIFAKNAVTLHEWYFEILGGDGMADKAPELSKAIAEKFGSVGDFIKYFSECGIAARGWCVLAWDTKEGKLKQYNTDVHHEGVWGAFPVITLDVYEHAYFIDYGSDRKAYITDYWKNLNWEKAEELYKKVRDIKF